MVTHFQPKWTDEDLAKDSVQQTRIAEERDALLATCKALLLHIGMYASDRISPHDTALIEAREAIAKAEAP